MDLGSAVLDVATAVRGLLLQALAKRAVRLPLIHRIRSLRWAGDMAVGSSVVPQLPMVGLRLRLAVRRRWRKLRGLTGEFDRPEDSERSRHLTRCWDEKWPGVEPLGYLLRDTHEDRWVRFHSLHQSKRYAESPDEYVEIVRRHRIVLAELLGNEDLGSLVVIAQDWGSRDLAGGWSKSQIPGAWPWRIAQGEEPDLGFHYFWVATSLATIELDPLLTAVADDMAHVVLANAQLDWLYCPYDGGADVVLPMTAERDGLRDRHAEWLSSLPSGL